VLGGLGALEGAVVAAGVEGDLEAGRRDGPGVRGPGNDAGLVADGLLGFGLGQVGDGDLVAYAGLLLVPVGEGGLAGENGAGGLGEGGMRGGAEGDEGDERGGWGEGSRCLVPAFDGLG
jgi:hypothetical protein